MRANGVSLLNSLLKTAGVISAVLVISGVSLIVFRARADIAKNTEYAQNHSEQLSVLKEIHRDQNAREEADAEVKKAERAACEQGRMERDWCKLRSYPIPKKD